MSSERVTGIRVLLPDAPDFAHIERIVDAVCLDAGLTVHTKSTLKQFPGCVHWHCRRGKQTGTLEITLWPQANRLWFVVHANRRGVWIDDAIAQLKLEVERRID